MSSLSEMPVQAPTLRAVTSQRRPDIQGLRAIAVGLVIVYHAGLPVPGGFVGVDVFFVISGFVITAMLIREIETQGRVRFARFYLRRFRRLTPALALMLSVTLVMSAVALGPFGAQAVAAQTALGAVLLVANGVIAVTTGGYFDAPAESNPLLHTWSLSVEEQFYLFFPAVLSLAWVGWHATRGRGRRHGGRSRAVLVVAGVGVMSFAAAMWGAWGSTFPGPDALWGFYSPVTRAWEFAAGAVVALVPAPQWWGRGVRSTVWGLAGMTSLVATSLLVTGESPWPGPLTLVPVLATVAVILAGDSRSAHPNVVTQMLSRPRWVAVGDWSYSLYLWHWPCIVTAVMIWPRHVWVATVAAGLSVVPAVLSYRWVEEPLRRRSLSWDRHLVRVVAAVTIPPVLAAGGLFVASSHRWWSSRVDRYAEAIGATHVGFRYGCDQRIPLGEVAARCTWGADRPGTPIYLLGDSNADHITEAVVGAGEELGRPVTVANTNACPFLDVTFHDHRQGWRNQNDSCRDYVQKTVQHMMNTRPDTVVIANSDVYWHEQQIALGSPGEGSSTDLRVKMTALRSGLESTVKKLRSAGHQVLVVQGTPKWWDSHSWDPHRCSTISVMAASCRAAMTVTEAETGQGEVRAVVQDVVADAAASSQVTASSVSSGKSRDPLTGAHVIPTVAVWDTWAELCPEGICTTHDGDMVRYRDGNHLTVAQSKVLAAPLARQLQELG